MTDADGWTCIAYTHQTGESTWVKPEDDGLLIQSRQDADALLDANRAEANMKDRGWKGDYHSVARIPLTLALEHDSYIADALREEDDKSVAKFLNDPENRKFRTKDGVI